MGMGEGHEQVGDYVLLEVIGRGPRSTMHRARRRDRAGRIVAITRLHAPVATEVVAQLRDEAATLVALDHPAIAPLLDVVEEPTGRIALVTVYPAGGSLQEVLDRRHGLPWPQVVHLGRRLASALAVAHGAGIVHGDVAPSTVLLGAEGEPRLGGFGTGALYGRDDDASSDGDVHDLGVVMARALADRNDVPPGLAAVVERARGRHPAGGFDSARSLQQALEATAPVDEPTPSWSPLGPSAPHRAHEHDTGELVEPAGRRRSRSGVVRAMLAGLAVVALLVAGGIWVARDGGDTAATAAAPGDQVEAAPRRPEPRCAQVEDPAGQGQVLEADVDGRGCSLPLVVTEELVDGEATVVLMVPTDAGAAAGRYALGAVGDEVVVGDWDCDGTDTPAVVRHDSGEVFHFDGYGELSPTRAPTLPSGAAPAVVTDEEGCDHVVAAVG